MERQIELRRVDQPTRKASEASTEQQLLNESCLRYRSQRQLSSEMTGFCAFLQQPKKTCLQTLEAAAAKEEEAKSGSSDNFRNCKDRHERILLH